LYELLSGQLEAGSPPAEVLRDILKESGYMDMLTERASASEEEAARVENVNELMNAMAAWGEENPGGTLSNFLEEVSLAGDVDGWNREDNAVNFMTLHSAKGLEFKAVFLVGVEDGIIPSRQVLHDESKVEEERRLFYVGSTRAMELLECSYAERRFRFGSIVPSEPSRFIADVPEGLYQFQNCASYFGGAASASVNNIGNDRVVRGSSISSGSDRNWSSSANKGRASSNNASRQPSFFDKPVGTAKPSSPSVSKYNEFSQESEPQYRMGQVVAHKTFGQGKIVSISGLGPDMKLTVLFGDGVRRKLLAKFANLDYLPFG
jgi:DNA helicase-2/ATP-dependent DNA helicase PcrA